MRHLRTQENAGLYARLPDLQVLPSHPCLTDHHHLLRHHKKYCEGADSGDNNNKGQM
jgi:hypothetical protein